jgi:TetR/AcrR family transcriptional repressor of nem operon
MTDAKDHIIKVALSLFLKNSYKGLTMKEIVKKSGLSKGAFYHYFKNKEELFRTTLDFYIKTFNSTNLKEFSKKV